MTLRSSGKKEKVYEKGSEKNAVIFKSVLTVNHCRKKKQPLEVPLKIEARSCKI